MNKKERTLKTEDGQELIITKESWSKFKKSKKRILVPDNIKFTKGKEPYSMGLIFQNGKADLYYNSYGDCYRVTTANKPIPTELIKVDKPEKGKWYYCSDCLADKSEERGEIVSYKLFISDNEYCFTSNNKAVYIGYFKWRHYYEIIPIKD